MNVVNKLYTEWAWRSKTGTPSMDNVDDKAILDKLITEILGEDIQVLRIEEIISTLMENGIKDSYTLAKVKELYSSSDDTHKINFSKYFRSLSLSPKNLNIVTNVFGRYFDAKASQGMGKGETMIIMGIKGSKSGGTATKDVVVGSKMFEVKELSGGNKSTGEGGSFSLAKDGAIVGTEYAKSYNIFKTNFTPSIIEVLQEKLEENEFKILKSTYDYLQGSLNNQSNGFINATRQTCEILKRALPTIQPDDLSYISVNGKRSIAIDPDDASDIQPGTSVNLELGDEIGQAKKDISSLINLNWIKEPGSNLQQLENIITEFFNEITGIIVYPVGNPEGGRLYSASEARSSFKALRVTQSTVHAVMEKIRN